MGRLDGKAAVVTGGASGIGRACCLRFAEEGADVVVADVNRSGAEDTVGEVVQHGRRGLFSVLDATKVRDNERTMQSAVETFGKIDIVVTSAGIIRAVHESPDLKGRALSRIPMGRFAAATEIASAALYLASDDSAYTTGELLHVDGGYYTD